jgi:hypothetical protein
MYPLGPAILHEKTTGGGLITADITTHPDFKTRVLGGAAAAEVHGAACAVESTVGARVQGRAVTPLVRVPRLQQRSSAHLSP